jgi:hypothetical protein
MYVCKTENGSPMVASALFRGVSVLIARVSRSLNLRYITDYKETALGGGALHSS